MMHGVKRTCAQHQDLPFLPAYLPCVLRWWDKMIRWPVRPHTVDVYLIKWPLGVIYRTKNMQVVYYSRK